MVQYDRYIIINKLVEKNVIKFLVKSKLVFYNDILFIKSGGDKIQRKLRKEDEEEG